MTIRSDRANKPGAVCAEPGCTTILSRYNPEKYCSIHARKHPPQMIGHYTGTRRGRHVNDEPINAHPLEKTPEPEKHYVECTRCGRTISPSVALKTDGLCRFCNARPMNIDHEAIDAYLARRDLG